MTDPMPDDSPRAGVTRALEELSAGEPQAERRLLAIVYAELKRLAQAKMRRQVGHHTLQPTALVHEVYMRLLASPADAPRFQDRRHFFSAAASAMRSILVDHARGRLADKRGAGARRVNVVAELPDDELGERVVQVSEALERFKQEYPRQAQVIELLFFAGLSVGETAAALEISGRTVKRDWRFGKSWMLDRIRSQPS